MHDGQHVLNHFLVWRELFAVEYKQLGAVLSAKSLEPRETEPDEPVFVSDNKVRYLPCFDTIHQRHEFRPLGIEATPNVLDKLDPHHATSSAKVFQYATLIF
jgi:hypothetical protein